MTHLFFATDIHGSDICWKKFISAGKFYNADILILGGDMTGKAIVPVIHQGNSTYKVVLLQQTYELHTEAEVAEMSERIRSRGYYPFRTTREEIAELNGNHQKVDQLFHAEVIKKAEQWLSYADEKLKDTHIHVFLSPGNDDMFELDDVIRSSRRVELAEGRVVILDDHHEMISSGWTNPTPWHTFREEPDEKLRVRYEAMIKQLKKPDMAIFNFHAPPYGSGLDDAPELTADLRPKYAGNSIIPVGSRSGRNLIDKYQPLLGLHGHIHECKGAVRLGKTLCINPGSMYEQGSLLGTLINLEKGKIKSYIMTSG